MSVRAASIAPVTHKGRGAPSNPRGRFEQRWTEPDPEWNHAEDPAPETRLLHDATGSVLSKNDSPDIPFDLSLNPYRGCEHGCSYCYARPSHEYLGLSAGLDFETRIVVKEAAPRLLRRELSRRRYAPQTIAPSGVTDPYQPVERRLGLTRACLEVLAEFRNPVVVITKNHGVTRDADLLADLAVHEAAAVNLSITSLDDDLARALEPRASRPARRLRAIETLAQAGVPVGVMVAPVIPGLNDHEVPAILRAAADAGAGWAGWVMLRLGHGLKELFEQWLAEHRPLAREKVLARIRAVRGGRLNDTRWGVRQRGEGPYAEQVAALFASGRKAAGLAARGPALSAAAFRRAGGAQLELFPG
jgi:DNA repair photolyase